MIRHQTMLAAASGPSPLIGSIMPGVNRRTGTMHSRIAPIVIAVFALLGAIAPPAGAEQPTDTREPVQRTEAERAFVLEQMRLFLTTVVEIEEGLGSGDLDLVAREAAARGRKANAALARPPTLAAKESDAWKAMIGSVRSGFDQIAEEAAARAPTAKINKTLADTMRNCVACHQAYRIAAEAR
ncbi:hypothetical protein [Bradyrhizobium embrapense]|uniref:hypothetical protein n=1 Tax=Bradyrhizobium embrapense TaxID=630921 RepID=UPI00158B297C|nr:hypothetical protein [Bradyrhizobium embrapense]